MGGRKKGRFVTEIFAAGGGSVKRHYQTRSAQKADAIAYRDRLISSGRGSEISGWRAYKTRNRR